MHNALRPNSNKDGWHYLSFEEAAIIMARNPARERNEHGLFLFFDNFKLLLSTISTFGEAERYNNLGFEDIDQAADRLITAAETIQLLISDIENNDDLTDVSSVLNLILIKVRNLSVELQQCRNDMSDFVGERAYSCSSRSTLPHFECPCSASSQ